MSAVSPADEAYRQMTTALSALHDLLVRFGKALNTMQTHYGEVELANANGIGALAQEDAGWTVPADPGPLAQLNYDHGPWAKSGPGWHPFTDVANPDSRYVKPDSITGDNEWHYSIWTDGFSPSGFVRWYVQQAFHVDIFYEVTKYLSGDWAAYQRAGRVWSQLGLAYGDIGANLQRAAADTPSIWRGHAAEGCQELLVGIAVVLGAMHDACPGYAKVYQDTAQAALSANTALNDLLEQIADWALYAAGLSAAAAATEETVVGAFAFAGAAGVAIAKVGLLITKVVEAMNHFTTVVDAIGATLDTLSLGTDKLPTLPDLPGE
jgi:uncharacterized protein YukE